MLDIAIQEKNHVPVVDSLLLHRKLQVSSHHTEWMRRRIENYSFREGEDFFSKMGKSTGGRPRKEYLITLDMAKELCMLENNDVGKATRRYFIKAEKQLRKHEVARIASIQMRKTLTDIVKDSGENDRMHGHGYSTYTKLAYDFCGLKEAYKQHKKTKSKENFRDTLTAEELERVEKVEGIVKAHIEIGQKYSDIKETLAPLFTQTLPNQKANGNNSYAD